MPHEESNQSLIRKLGLCPSPGTKWVHEVSGGEYVVTGCAIIEVTLDPGVVYTSTHSGITWVRPLAEFLDGRFTKQEVVT